MLRKVRLIETGSELLLVIGEGRHRLYGFEVKTKQPSQLVYTKLDDGLWLTDTLKVVERNPAIRVLREYKIEDWVIDLLYTKYRNEFVNFVKSQT